MGKQRIRHKDKPPHEPASSPRTQGASTSRRRLWVLVSLLLLLVGVVAYSGGLAVLPRELARRSLEARDFEAAWRRLELAERLSYRDPANALLAVRIARWQGDAERLVAAVERAEQRSADPRAVRREQVLAMAQSGQLDMVEPELIEFLREAGPEAAEISDAYVNGLAMAGRFEDAITVIDGWRRDFPDDPRPNYRLGRIQEHGQMYEEAEASYRRALDKRGDYYPARYSLGRVLLRERRASEAADQFRACLQMPRSEAAQVELAVALKALGKAEEAAPLLRHVLEQDHALLQASYIALDERPEGFKAAAEYGRLQADAGKFREAERWLRVALKHNPQDLLARYALAVSLRGLGKQDEAEEHFARVRESRKAMQAANPLNDRIRRNPEDLEARYLLGKLILENESERTGLYWIRSILTYDPDYRPAHELLAQYYAARSGDQSHFAPLAEYHRRKAAASPAPPEAQAQP